MWWKLRRRPRGAQGPPVEEDTCVGHLCGMWHLRKHGGEAGAAFKSPQAGTQTQTCAGCSWQHCSQRPKVETTRVHPQMMDQQIVV